MIDKRYQDISDAYAQLNALSKNKALYKGHINEILKMKRFYYHNLKGLKKQLGKQHNKEG